MDNPLCFLDLTLQTPEENLACDEALFLVSEQRGGDGTLRFWMPDRVFVVVGYTNSVEREVNTEVCRSLGIPILRRFTGGGTVVQMPGCLNFTLVHRIQGREEFKTIASTNRFIMDAHRRVLAALPGLAPVTIEGVSDLALNGMKFCGNAQRRGSTALLFHGVFLCSADLQLISRLLPYPSRSPAYRQHRSHAKFLTNIDIPPDDLKREITKVWRAETQAVRPPQEEIQQLVGARYGQKAWNFRR